MSQRNDVGFWENLSAMDPGPPHVRTRRERDDGLIALGAVLYESLLSRQIGPAFDDALRTELLGRTLSGDSTRRELGIPATDSKPAC